MEHKEIIINGVEGIWIPKEKELTPQEKEEIRINHILKTYSEHLQNKHSQEVDYIIYSKESHKDELTALSKLLALRDIYNGDWKPDWNNKKECKYCIIMDINQYAIDYHFISLELFAFKRQKVAELFLENFKDLLEQVKGLF